MSCLWKQDWDLTKERITGWWSGDGLVVSVTGPAKKPVEALPEPVKPNSYAEMWLDPVYRAKKAEYELSRSFFIGEAFPFFDTTIGPGCLASVLGSPTNFSENTVWYEPCIDDPGSCKELVFLEDNFYFKKVLDIIDKGLEVAQGRYLVGMTDLLSHIDVLASLRGVAELMIDMLENPEFVIKKSAEINRVFMKAFDFLYNKIKDENGANADSWFRIWGPGKSAKLQCDTSALFSPMMFEQFVVPYLTEQAQFVDYALYHLDGTQCIAHLDHILGIKEIKAVEWTPQAGLPGGGDPMWYDLYRKILKEGKSLQVIFLKPQDVEPLLHAIGINGVYLHMEVDSEEDAKEVMRVVEKFR